AAYYTSPIQAPAAGLAALFAVEYATARLWQRWGVQPAALLGHSMGEYTAACLAGVMDLETALGLVAVRGKLFESLPADGAMLSVPLSEEELKPWLGPEHCISVINRHDSLVVSSTAEGIDQLHNKLDAAGIECTRLHIAVAAHSPQVEPILEAFGKYLASAKLKAPALPVVSNVTGTWLTDEQAISVDYWLSHLRNTVRFHDGLSTLFRFSEEKPLTLLETGPGQTLSGFARLHPQRKGQAVLASIRHPREQTADRSFILKSLAQLWVQGFDINWQQFYAHKNWRRLPLPTYPFEKQRHFLPPAMVETLQTIALRTITTLPPTPEDSRPTMSQPTKTRKDVLTDEVRNILYELSGMDPESMDPSAAFLELGFDSLFLSQAVIRFNKRFNSQLSFRALFEEVPTIAALAAHLDETLPAGVFEPEVTPSLESGQPQQYQQFQQSQQPGTVTPLAPLEGGARQLQKPGQLQQSQQSQQSQQYVEDSPLATLIQQQLNLMQQQLDLLRGTTQPPGLNPSQPLSTPLNPSQQSQQSQQFQQPGTVTPLAPLEGGTRQEQPPGQLQQSQQFQQSQQSAGDSPLATLIQQQLNLMQQQLDLLRG
ncbi:MAG: acyltransferase domain-containing protein, partial [Gammaproteobacteria bacterium]